MKQPDEQYAKFPSTTECAREDCNQQATPFTLDTQGEQARVVWSCEDNHVFTTDVKGQDKQN